MSIQQQSDGASETLSNALAQLRLKLLDLTGRYCHRAPVWRQVWHNPALADSWSIGFQRTKTRETCAGA